MPVPTDPLAELKAVLEALRALTGPADPPERAGPAYAAALRFLCAGGAEALVARVELLRDALEHEARHSADLGTRQRATAVLAEGGGNSGE